MRHDSLSLGRTGWIPDERVKPGDIVAGPDGGPHRIREIGPPGARSAPDVFGVAYCVPGDEWAIELKHGGRCKVYLSKAHLREHARTANTERDLKGFTRPL